MKKLLLYVPILVLFIVGPSFAFHAGGVAHCDGCHTMHNSMDGTTDNGSVGQAPGDFLLKSTDPSSVCLNCHYNAAGGSYHVFSSDGSNFKPAGDFYWLTRTYTWTAHGSAQISKGSNHGHSIVASDFGLPLSDPVLTTSPGGNYPSIQMKCTACHDPHGKKANNNLPISGSGSYGDTPIAGTTLGNYRLLGDIGYHPGGTSITFTNPPPIARAPKTYDPETDINHVDYGQGMSEWCGNCHGLFVAPGGAGQHKHPASNTSGLSAGGIYQNYNMYVASGDVTGNQSTAYLELVPFERQKSDPTLLDPTTTVGPDSNSNVMCLTCHRAHASAFPNSGRWDFETEYPATDSHPHSGDGGLGTNDVYNSYYGRDLQTEFGQYQRSLCNKCHVKD
jgi:hypothetical protein